MLVIVRKDCGVTRNLVKEGTALDGNGNFCDVIQVFMADCAAPLVKMVSCKKYGAPSFPFPIMGARYNALVLYTHTAVRPIELDNL